MRVLLALDLNSASHHAFHVALRSLFTPVGVDELVLCSVHVPPNFDADARNDVRDRLINRLDVFASECEAVGFPCKKVFVVSAKPRQTLLDVAAEHGADTMVLGVRGLRSLGRLFTGSTSEAMLADFPGHVALVRPPTRLDERVLPSRLARRMMLVLHAGSTCVAALRAAAALLCPADSVLAVTLAPESLEADAVVIAAAAPGGGEAAGGELCAAAWQPELEAIRTVVHHFSASECHDDATAALCALAVLDGTSGILFCGDRHPTFAQSASRCTALAFAQFCVVLRTGKLAR